MNKKKEEYVDVDSIRVDESWKESKKVKVPEPEPDSYDFYLDKDNNFVIRVKKGEREYKVVRPAKEIKTTRKMLQNLAKYMLRKGLI